MEQAPQAPANTEENQEDAATADADDALTKLQQELDEEKKRHLYLYAEFENYKKRAIKERSDLVKFGHEPLAREILLIKDNFERGLQHSDNPEALVAGLQMVAGDMKRVLERFAITEIKTVGEKFDPNLHEAVGQEESDQDGVIVREHQKGYTLHGRLLRPAKVVVGALPKS